MGDANTTLTTDDARHLLRRTSFGGATRDRDITRLAGQTRGDAAAGIVGFRPSTYRPTGKDIRVVHDKWLKTMITTRRQFQERLVLFWHDHFATSSDVVGSVAEMAEQNRTLRIHCIGAHLRGGVRGSFRDFVKAINRDPAMMDMLDTRRNRKEFPNENYARELLELFTIGVFDAAGNPNYTEDDVQQIARAFTGWRVNSKGQAYFDGGSGEINGGATCNTSRTGRHDYAACFPQRGPKVIFQSTGGFGPTGRDYTVDGEGAVEIDTVTDIIFEHRDSDGHNTVARYIGGRLYEHFGHAEPDLGVVDEIIAASAFDTTFQVQDFLHALFCHDAFYAGTRRSVRWPADYAAGTMRLLRMKPRGKVSEYFVNGGGFGRLRDHLTNMGQRLLEPPSVFGWDLEDGWLSSSTMLARFAFARDVTAARGRGSSAFRPERLIDINLTDPAAIVEAVLELLQVREQFDVAEKQVLIDYMGPGPVDLNDEAYRNVKLNGLFALVLQSPAYQLY